MLMSSWNPNDGEAEIGGPLGLTMATLVYSASSQSVRVSVS